MNSDIMRQPPHVREIWDWLLMNANHTEGKSSGTIIKRGQLFTSLNEIKEGLCWYVGYRKMSYTKDHTKKAMKALKKASMITTNVSTKGMLITICNYDRFQDPKNYESTNESTNESTDEAPMKHRESPHHKQEGKNYKNEKKKELYIDHFEEFWNLYGMKKDRAKCEVVYKRHMKNGIKHETILEGLRGYQAECRKNDTAKEYIKRPLTWLNGKNWNDEYERELTDEEKLEEIKHNIGASTCKVISS